MLLIKLNDITVYFVLFKFEWTSKLSNLKINLFTFYSISINWLSISIKEGLSFGLNWKHWFIKEENFGLSIGNSNFNDPFATKWAAWNDSYSS